MHTRNDLFILHCFRTSISWMNDVNIIKLETLKSKYKKERTSPASKVTKRCTLLLVLLRSSHIPATPSYVVSRVSRWCFVSSLFPISCLYSGFTCVLLLLNCFLLSVSLCGCVWTFVSWLKRLDWQPGLNSVSYLLLDKTHPEPSLPAVSSGVPCALAQT